MTEKKAKEKMFVGMCNGHECSCLAAIGPDKKEVLEAAEYMHQICKIKISNEGWTYAVSLVKQGNLWKMPKR